MLDFLVNYELQLLGNVTRELADGIKSQITIGLIQGESVAKISKNIGGIITDPDEFRRAGKTVFRTAQTRTETIARTETLRAYGQGRHKFYEQVGITYVIWMSVGDKSAVRRMPCLPGTRRQQIPAGKAPGVPLHPNCRCTLFAAPESLGMKEEIRTAGPEVIGVAAADDRSAVKVMTPEDIARKAREKRSEK